MDTRYYQAQGLDIERLAVDLEHMFLSQGYQVQHFGNRDQMTVQMRKGGDLAAIVGMQTALTVMMQRSEGGVLAMVGQQKWVDKAVVGAVGLIAAPVLWPLMITAGVGAIQQVSLANQVTNALDTLVHQQNPNVQVGPIPPEIMPQYGQPGARQAYSPPPWQRWAPWARPATPFNQVVCPNCQALNEAGNRYCMRCGHELPSQGPQRALCPNCGAVTKPGATFCTNCGTPLPQQEGEKQQA
jgi:ribosomal protein L40E